MINGYGAVGSRISTRNLGLVAERATEIGKALQKVGAENYVADEVLVKLRTAEVEGAEFSSEYGCQVGGLNTKMGSGRLLQMGLPPALSLPEALALLAADPRVEYAELNGIENISPLTGKAEPAPVRVAIERESVAVGETRLKRQLIPLRV